MEKKPTLTVEQSCEELTRKLQDAFSGSEGINLNQFFANLAEAVTIPNNQPWGINAL